ncbi:unnamed protein product, partial [Ectocarpus sp. 12 AP-2014]
MHHPQDQRRFLRGSGQHFPHSDQPSRSALTTGEPWPFQWGWQATRGQAGADYHRAPR